MMFHIMVKERYPNNRVSTIRFNICVILVGLLGNLVAMAEHEPETIGKTPQQCRMGCESAYGIELGKSPVGIPAYSNCNADCVIFEPHHFNDIYTGIKWQCVEYARRWLLREKSVVFGDVDIAADIWSMQQVENPINKLTLEFVSIVNGSAEVPQRGDLLIYGKDYLGTGHVAVVIGVDEEKQKIQIAEQNYANTKWQNEYAREINYIFSDKRVWLLDGYLIGWKRVLTVKR